MALLAFLRSRNCLYVSSLLIIGVSIAGCGGGATSTPQGIMISVNPQSASVQVAGTQTFSAAVSNTSNTAVTWKVNGVAGGDDIHGRIDSAGIYKAPAAVPAPPTVTVTAASSADATRSASAMVTITGSAPSTATLTISPVRAALTTAQSQAFTATGSGNAAISVTWEVDSIPGGNSSVGTVSATGVYSPPSAAGTHTVAARSVADSSATGSASVYITN